MIRKIQSMKTRINQIRQIDKKCQRSRNPSIERHEARMMEIERLKRMIGLEESRFKRR